jgi:transposase-like protein
MSEDKVTRRVRRSAAQWSQLVQAYFQSGVTQRAFCESNGLAPSSFYKALSRYRSAGSTIASTVDAPFAAVSLDGAVASPGWEVEIELSPSVFIRMRTR